MVADFGDVGLGFYDTCMVEDFEVHSMGVNKGC